jgi:hypothetical protein
MQKPHPEDEPLPDIHQEIIEGTPDADVEQAIFEMVCNVLDDCPNGEVKALQSMPRGFRYVFATMLLENEVNNGGFLQFFYNQPGKWFLLAVDGFKKFGCTERVDILDKVAEQFLRERPKLKRQWDEGTIEAFFGSYKTSKVNKLADEWFALPDASPARIRYIRKNIKHFVG